MAASGTVDALSLILSRLKLETSVAGAFDARGDYSVEIGDYVGLKMHLVLRGDFWLTIEGETSAINIREGDCVLLTNGKNARFSTKPNAKRTVHLETLAGRAVDGVMTLNGGGGFFGIGLHFVFSGHFPKILFAQLPSTILVPSHNAQAAALRGNIEKFREEFTGHAPGRALVLEHLAPIILLQILRSHGSSNFEKRDWLWTLTDPQLSRAIAVMHGRPGEAWTLESLAETANMSRSGFAATFTKQVGLTPIEYLTHWRMHLAGELLSNRDLGLAEVAERVGYRSESAFSTAFKNIMKCRPGHYAREARL